MSCELFEFQKNPKVKRIELEQKQRTRRREEALSAILINQIHRIPFDIEIKYF